MLKRSGDKALDEALHAPMSLRRRMITTAR
jgi:hypothetical protein